MSHSLRLRTQADESLRQEQRHRDEQRAEEVQPELREGRVNQLFAPLTKKAPTIGPISVPRPPTAAQIAISIDAAGLTSRPG